MPDSRRDESASAFMIGRDTADTVDTSAVMHRARGVMSTESIVSKLADMTVLMPFDFLKLVWAAFLGIIFFAEIPDLLTWVGGAIVFGSSFYIAWREAKLRKAKALSPAGRIHCTGSPSLWVKVVRRASWRSMIRSSAHPSAL